MKKIPTMLFTVLIILTTSLSLLAADNDQPVVQSGSAIVMEVKTGQILYEKQIHKKEYPASITKIITAILALENGNLDDILTFSDTAVYSIEPGSSHLWMVPGEQITLEQALHGLLIVSANDVANGIAEFIDGSIENFADHMNQKAKELGATDTHFVNPHGLHDEKHYTTAYDMALIAREALHYPKFREIIKTLRYEIPPTNKNDIRYLLNQHKMLENPIYYPTYFYDGCEGGKTGYTGEAGHTLVTFAKKDDMELIVVILDSSSQDMMYTDTTHLLDYDFDHFELHQLSQKDHIIKTLPIADTVNKEKNHSVTMELRSEKDLYYVFSKPFDPSKLQTEINLPNQLDPPIKKNDSLGSIEYRYNNQIIGTVGALASSSYVVTTPVYASQIEKQQMNNNPSLNRLLEMTGLLILLVILLCFVLILLRYRYAKPKS